MSLTLKERNDRRKNPEKWDFEKLQRQLEQDRLDAMMQIVNLSLAKEKTEELIKQKMDEFKKELIKITAQELDEIEMSFTNFKRTFDGDVKDIIKDSVYHAELKLTQMTGAAEKNTLRFVEIVELIKIQLSNLTSSTEEKVLSFFKESEKFRGAKGKSGDNGKPGKDGSPDTPEEIAIKVNTLTEAIDMTTIRGLREYMKSLQSSFSKKTGGGGSGKVMHESFNVTALTTTVTVTTPIAGNGTAIIGFRYQGQVQFQGREFTVGTDRKTITLLFTPENSTVVDITYIR